jgi:hypothetical protein
MKFAAAVIFLLLSANAWGDSGKKPIKPKSPAAAYNQNSSGQRIPLESQIVHIKQNYRALGFAGGTRAYQVEGEKSPVRLVSQLKLEFVFSLEDSIDPLETIQFYHFDQVSGSRVMPINDFDAFGQPTKITLNHGTVDFNATKQGVSSFKLIPVQLLVPGEYCLIIKDGNQWPKKSPGFCFGVDPAGK